MVNGFYTRGYDQWTNKKLFYYKQNRLKIIAQFKKKFTYAIRIVIIIIIIYFLWRFCSLKRFIGQCGWDSFELTIYKIAKENFFDREILWRKIAQTFTLSKVAPFILGLLKLGEKKIFLLIPSHHNRQSLWTRSDIKCPFFLLQKMHLLDESKLLDIQM